MADIRPSDRELYLARVATALRLPNGQTSEVTEELAGHIADATESLRAEGLDADWAEREALARLGSPEELAGGIRRAHQTRRRLLVAAGFGLVAAGRFLLGGFLVATGLATVVVVTTVSAYGAVIDALGRSASGFEAGSIYLPVALAGIAWAGRVVPATVAHRSRRAVADVRGGVALVGAAVLGFVMMFGIRTSLDLAVVAGLIAVPVAFALGALSAGRPLPVRPTLARALALTALLAAVNMAAAVATTTWNPTGPDLEMAPIRLPYPDVFQLDESLWPVGAGSSRSGDVVEATVSWASSVDAAGWSDVRLEIWLADESGVTGAAPVSVTTMPIIGTDATATAPVPRPTDRRWYRPIATAVGPDGERYVVGDGGEFRVDFVGSAWDWLTSR